jgi:hypothetical protein
MKHGMILGINGRKAIVLSDRNKDEVIFFNKNK